MARKYTAQRLVHDIIAGITVGIIAIPLAMALAIASGVPLQYGLYTSAIAGIVIAVTGGSRYSVSSPTAAFMVSLPGFPAVWPLRLADGHTTFRGILVLMGVCRFGRLIEYIPLSVTLGFTSGIGITIATMQIKDLFGLNLTTVPEHYIEKVMTLEQALPTLTMADTLIGLTTLAVLVFWPKLGIRLPGHLPALLAGVAVMGIMSLIGHDVATIGSRFSYMLADGSQGQGIPPILPQWMLPWNVFAAGEPAMTLNWQSISALLPAAFSMAMLGAIESILCAVVLDGMTGKKTQLQCRIDGTRLR